MPATSEATCSESSATPSRCVMASWNRALAGSASGSKETLARLRAGLAAPAMASLSPRWLGVQHGVPQALREDSSLETERWTFSARAWSHVPASCSSLCSARRISSCWSARWWMSPTLWRAALATSSSRSRAAIFSAASRAAMLAWSCARSWAMRASASSSFLAFSASSAWVSASLWPQPTPPTLPPMSSVATVENSCCSAFCPLIWL
mmetsp:Transcript_8466/g.24985  ORF Transcript_8466/g.24985 Transcript_8466/m.24985 type:complete len:208 (+) Transcript_8466:801-1424(+)